MHNIEGISDSVLVWMQLAAVFTSLDSQHCIGHKEEIQKYYHDGWLETYNDRLPIDFRLASFVRYIEAGATEVSRKEQANVHILQSSRGHVRCSRLIRLRRCLRRPFLCETG